MKTANARSTLLSWGKYPPCPQYPTPVHWREELLSTLQLVTRSHGPTLAYGSGLSYGDSCLAASDHVLHLRPLDRFLGADWERGILIAEAGITLENILAVAIPHGWFLPVTPGTKYITLGGAIANDVHGKNHHRSGTFGCHVRRFGLLRSDLGRLTCSRRENFDRFSATIGGLGLTGIIEWAEIQLTPIRTSRIDTLTQRFHDLDEFFSLSDELDFHHDYSVSWIDCAAKGSKAGRGRYMAGDFAEDGPLEIADPRRYTFPFTPPLSLINRVTLRAFNEVYWRKSPSKPERSTTGYDPFFYPLDALLEWNRIYGPHGLQQYQALIPAHNARDGIRAMLDAIANARTGSGHLE